MGAVLLQSSYHRADSFNIWVSACSWAPCFFPSNMEMLMYEGGGCSYAFYLQMIPAFAMSV